MRSREEALRRFAFAHHRPLRLAQLGLAAIGYLLCATVLATNGLIGARGLGGGDVLAYWTAGSNVLAGAPVYGVGVGGYGAFLYLPPMAQLFAPLALLPFPAAAWVWRAVELAGLRLAVGSWTNVGLALLLWPPIIPEIDSGNVHLLIAGAVAMSIRGRPGAIGPVALTKFASLAAVPLALVNRPRALAKGFAAVAVIVMVSAILAPRLWVDYFAFALHSTAVDTGWANIGRDIPLPLRLGAAGLAALGAMRWPRLAAVAATLALPVLWLTGLSVLIAGVARPSDPNPLATWMERRRSGPTLPSG